MTGSLASPVEYALPVGEVSVPLNPLLGQTITLSHAGLINCIACGRKTPKSFGQGHCYPCFRSLARCDLCIVKPELCHYHAGTCREPDWADRHCMQPHIVYLANSSGLKIGITRRSQVPTRWIDQGATQALPVFRVANRYHSGLIEAAMKPFVSDRTDWRRLLKSEAPELDLAAQRNALLEEGREALDGCADGFQGTELEPLADAQVTSIGYPVLRYPDKVKSLSFDKAETIRGQLLGIKGQYLILDSGVLNVRKFAGYFVELTSP
jgi:hypothetical protein